MPFGHIPPSGQNPAGAPPAYSRHPNPGAEFRGAPRRPPAYAPGPPPPYNPSNVQQQGPSGAPVWGSAADIWQQRRPGSGGEGGSGTAGAPRESRV